MNTKIMFGCLAVAAFLSSGCTRQIAPANAGSMPDPAGQAGGLAANGGQAGGELGGRGAGNGMNGAGQGGRGGAGGGAANGNGANGGGYGNAQGGNGMANGGGYGNGGYGNANGGHGNSPYTPADLNNPASILAQRVIYFDYDQSHIRAEYLPVLAAHASLLAAYPNLNVRLEGHADERGSREYNVALSERRGYSVRDYMTVKGMNPKQADIVGYGEEVPATLGRDEKSWSENRRVEIIYAGE